MILIPLSTLHGRKEGNGGGIGSNLGCFVEGALSDCNHIRYFFCSSDLRLDENKDFIKHKSNQERRKRAKGKLHGGVGHNVQGEGGDVYMRAGKERRSVHSDYLCFFLLLLLCQRKNYSWNQFCF